MKLSAWLEIERGRGAALASAIGVSPVLVSQWSTGPRVPPIERCVPIERATAGQVSRRDLRPDDYLDIWPELGPAPQQRPLVPEIPQATPQLPALPGLVR